jgi:hypothetical protein
VFSVAFEDTRFNLPSAIGRGGWIWPTGGKAIQVCYPGPWPQPGGSDGQDRTRVLVHFGDKLWWSTFVAVLDSSNPCVVVHGLNEIQENQTGSMVDRNGYPLVTVTNTYMRQAVWQPNMQGVIRMRTIVRAPIENGHAYIAAAVGCTTPCGNCSLDPAVQGKGGATVSAPGTVSVSTGGVMAWIASWFVTPTSGPLTGQAAWDSGKLVADGDVCWWRKPLDYGTLRAVDTLCITRSDRMDVGEKIGACLGWDGKVRCYDTSKQNPLANPVPCAS